MADPMADDDDKKDKKKDKGEYQATCGRFNEASSYPVGRRLTRD